MRPCDAQRAIVLLIELLSILGAGPAMAQLATPPGFSVGTSGQSCSGSTIQYGWPDANGQILKCSSNVWSVVSQTAAAGGSSGQVQFNSSNALAGSSNFTWDNTNVRLGIGTVTPTNMLTLYTTATTGKVDVLDIIGNIGTGGNNYPRLRIDNVNAGSYKSSLGSDGGNYRLAERAGGQGSNAPSAVTGDGTGTSTLGGTKPTAGSLVKTAISYSPSASPGFTFYQNGASIGNVARATASSGSSTFGVGQSGAGVNQLDGWITRLTYFPVRQLDYSLGDYSR
ncbi:hypothetical protein AB7M17_004207 [Bradyrhizobium sp. USDA 377]